MPDVGALFDKETQTPRRPPHGEPALHHDQSLSSIEPQALSPRTLRVTAGNVEDRTIRTPCRRTGVNHLTHIAASPVPLATSRRSSGGIGHVETERESDGAKTPAIKCGSCAICLSPLVKRDVYTIQLCRHSFHRGCLEENRKAGNAGCPYCRGALETGLTPMATKAEREAAAAAARQEEQRQAIRSAAARARMAMARTRRW